MTQHLEPRIGIQAAAFSDAIHVGTLTTDRGEFLSKKSMTAEVMGAVADYVDRHHDGIYSGTVFRADGSEIKVTVQTVKTIPEETP